jgi:hypothetical protein
MISFSPGSISLRALLATVAVVGAATFVAGRASQSAAFVISPFTVCSEAIAAAFPVEAPYLTENDAAMKQAPQAITYVPNAVPEGDGTQGLQQLDIAGRATHLDLGTLEDRKTVGSAGNASSKDKAPTSVSLFDQGLTQVFQASVTGLQPKMPYVLVLSSEPTGRGKLEAIASFMTNPVGSAIVNTVGPIRQIVQGEQQIPRRYLAIAEGHPEKPGQSCRYS